MALRREHVPPSPEPTRIGQSNRLALLLILGSTAAGFAILHEATRPIWSRWGASEPLAPPLTETQIEAMQTPVSANALDDDWNVPRDRLRRLVSSAESPQGIDAEVDRRWRSVISGLSPGEKFALLQTLLVATGERPTSTPDAEPTVGLSPETLAELRTQWETEHADLFEMLASAPGGSGEGAELVRGMRERVSRQLDALAAAGQEADLTDVAGDDPPVDAEEASKQTLLPVLRAWDGAALSAVKDATANGDPGDFALWYRLFQRLAHVSDESLREAVEGRVTEAALMRQPDARRGELFTLVGVARGGKSVEAQRNVLGIDRYYVIWVQPDDDRDALIALYSLSKPEGFPDLPESGEFVRFAMPVEAPSYFLKKFAYESESGISVSPQVLARSFRFEPPQPESASGPPSLPSLAIGIAFALVAGTTVVLYVLRKTRRDPNDPEETPDRIDESVLRKRFVESP